MGRKSKTSTPIPYTPPEYTPEQKRLMDTVEEALKRSAAYEQDISKLTREYIIKHQELEQDYRRSVRELDRKFMHWSINKHSELEKARKPLQALQEPYHPGAER